MVVASMAGSSIGLAEAPGLKKDKAPPPAAKPTSPTSPMAAPELALPKERLYEQLLTFTKSRDWILNAELRLGALLSEDVNGVVANHPLKIKKASIVFPFPAKSAAHESADFKKVTSDMRFAGAAFKANPQIMDGFPSGTRLGRWDLADVETTAVVLNLQIPMTSSETVLDEDLAKRIPWPTRPLPAVAASTLLPQMGVDFEPVVIKGVTTEQQIKETRKVCEELIKRWTNGQDLKKLPPWTAAKFLAQQVSSTVQTSGNGTRNNSDASLAGFELQGALRTLNQGRGSDFDLVCALAAIYRTAGIPCRTVIGLDASGGGSGGNGLSGKGRGKGRDKLAAWIEIALIDPATNKEMWIPIDLLKLKRKSSQMPDLDKPWPFFGTNDELAYAMPIAYQFHPPTNVYSQGYPAFYGWTANAETATPVTGRITCGAEQSIRFFSTTQPITAEDQRAKREEQEKNKPQR